MADFALAVHGGAGTPKVALEESGFHIGLAQSLRAGHEVLADGGSAIDAVEAAVVLLEDNPIFNAGRGAVLNEPGDVEHDAAVMCGRTKQAGAVAAVTGVRHPVRLAREVFEEGRHVFIVGEGAEAFADERGLERVDPAYHRTEQQADSWKTVAGDTVGAVAVDASGSLAAATSTGGLRGKRPGRVGDCPVIGAGTWADTHCAVSASGDGEAIMLSAAAHDISRLLAYKRIPLDDACEAVVHEGVGGEIGVIAIDRSLEVALPFNCGVFHRGVIYEDGIPLTAVGPGEPTAVVS